MLLCDACRREPERFADVVRVESPRRGRDGQLIEPLVSHYCGWACLSAATKPKQTPGEPCRPWCCSITENAVNACDCLDEYPLDNAELEPF